MAEYEDRKRREAEIEHQRRQQHEADVNDMAKRIKFD
jgi:hypothetical protein